MPEIQQNLNNNDFSQTDTIHFSCEQCGKCCSKAPSMSFYDMLELSEEFIFKQVINQLYHILKLL